MRVIIRPVAEPKREVDLTRRLVPAIAKELWELYGGNDHLNWMEAELYLAQIVGQARFEARHTEVVHVPVPSSGRGTRRHADSRLRRPLALKAR